MAYRMVNIMPYYLISVDWAMIKMISLMEINTIRDFIKDFIAKVDSTLYPGHFNTAVQSEA
jgi:hypothetical protein